MEGLDHYYDPKDFNRSSTITGARIFQNPSDPDATFREKAGKTHPLAAKSEH